MICDCHNNFLSDREMLHSSVGFSQNTGDTSISSSQASTLVEQQLLSSKYLFGQFFKLSNSDALARSFLWSVGQGKGFRLNIVIFTYIVDPKFEN